MIILNRREVAKIAAGQYINLYDKDGVDLFVIINEGNGINQETIRSAVSYLEEVSAQYNLNDVSNSDIKEELEDNFFPYGVQIIRKAC